MSSHAEQWFADTRVELVFNPIYDTLDLYITRAHLPDGTFEIAKPVQLEFEKKSQFELVPGPVCHIPWFLGKQLMEKFRENGQRPEHEEHVEGELKATKDHLQDARLIRDRVLAIVEKQNAPRRIHGSR